MSRNTTILSFLVLAGAVNAQPVLTFPGHAPTQGQSYVLRYGPFVQPGNAGAAQTWDLSALSTDSMHTITMVDPATTVNAAEFPGATVAETGAEAIMYWRAAADGMYLSGSDAGDALIPYSDEGRYLPFPCSFNTTWTDDVAAEFSIEGTDVVRNGTIVGEADGYGTLIMPTWTATNVLRVHWHEETTDVTDMFTMESVYDSYLYFVQGQSYPIVQLVHAEVSFLGQTIETEHAQWVNQLSTGIGSYDGEALSLDVFPNPAHNTLNVVLPAELQGTARITIADAQGRIVDQLRDATFNGDNGQIDISALPASIYLLTATDTQGASATRRFVVE
jgi:hypothetical protein